VSAASSPSWVWGIWCILALKSDIGWHQSNFPENQLTTVFAFFYLCVFLFISRSRTLICNVNIQNFSFLKLLVSAAAAGSAGPVTIRARDVIVRNSTGGQIGPTASTDAYVAYRSNLRQTSQIVGLANVCMTKLCA